MSTRRSRLVFALNMTTALLFGLSLLAALAAPFNMLMSAGQSFEAMLIVAVLCGSIPLGCAASVALCQRLVTQGHVNEAVILATIPLLPLLLFAALLAWTLMGN